MSENSGLILDALRKTNPSLALSVSVGDSWKTDLNEQGARVALFRRYEEGDHRASITDQMRNMLRLTPADDSGILDFNDNYCRIIVDKMSSRLKVSHITTTNDSIDSTWLDPLLLRNDWQALQGTVFQAAVRDGEAFIMVDPQTTMWSSEPTYDGFDGIVALFDAFGKNPIWACKLWSESIDELDESDDASPMRVVVYEPTRISYWHGKAGGEEVFPDDRVEVTTSEAALSSTPFTNVIPWPPGKVPIIHFVNQFSNATGGGKSEIRPAIPLQDVMNRTLHSMVMASEFSAFRIKWSIGMEIDAQTITPGAIINLVLKDKTGNIITEMSPELVSFMNAVRVGQFEETDISQYIQQIDKLAREISQISQTPIYGVTTEGVLSGEALKQLEIGLIGKCERFQRENTDAIRQLVELTSVIQNAFVNELGNAPTDFPAISVIWSSPELLDVGARIDLLVKMRKDAPGLWDDGFYREKIGALLGMNQKEVKEMGDRAGEAGTNLMDLLVGAGGRSQPPVVA